ncbi:MAG: serine/threonine protein kinase [Blastocatellia bacterium]
MLAPNTILQNRYLIHRLLAQGGMGAVYEAHDQRLGNVVALKETFFSEDYLREAFHREASMLAALRHQSLPKVIDHFTENDGQFLVMEFIRGDDLARLLELYKGPIPVRDVMHWGDQLLGALEYLHTQSQPVIHRDIKPQNLKLNERGEIILLDFGLAKGARAGHTASAGQSVRGYTLSYAPLEQIQGEGTDPRSDLYSAAATLYHLMTGVVPPDALTRATAVIGGAPDPLIPASQVNPKVPPLVASVLQQALTQDRQQRFASATIMRRAMQNALNSPAQAQTQPGVRETGAQPAQPATAEQRPAPVTAPENQAPARRVVHSPAPQRQRKWLWPAMAAGALALTLGAGVWLGRGNKTEPARGAAPNAPATTTTSSDPAPDFGAAIPLASAEILARPDQKDVSYALTAGPGKLKLTLNVIGKGTSVAVDLFDDGKKQLRFQNGQSTLSAASSALNEQTEASVILERATPLVIHIENSSPDALQALRLRLDGPAKFAAGKDETAHKSAALAQLFAPRDNPRGLLLKQVFGGQQTEAEVYYGFSAGPGEIEFALDVIAAGANVTVEWFDEHARPLKFRDGATTFATPSSGPHEASRQRLLLDREQRVIMRIVNSNPAGTQGYRLKLNGPLQLAIDGLPEETAKSAAAMNLLFARRDTPAPLKGNDLSGTTMPKEGYYKLIAGPGEVKVMLEIESAGATLGAEFFDAEDRDIKFETGNSSQTIASTGKPEQKAATITLDREQPLLLRLTNSYPDSTRSWRVSLSGPVKPAR